MFLRPTTSDSDDQPNRPAELNSDSSATKPAAALAVTFAEVPEKKSVIIGAAFSRMPMPAVTFRQSTIHRSQNCGVRRALLAETLAVVISGFSTTIFGSQPAGFHPGGGTRTTSTPNVMKTAYTMPWIRNASATPP